MWWNTLGETNKSEFDSPISTNIDFNEMAMKQLIYFPKIPQSVQTDQGQFFVNFANSRPAGYKAFQLLMFLLNQNLAPRAFAIEPKEYAQDISDVSNNQNSLNLSLSLAAAFGQLSANDTASYLKQATVALQAIKRNPLAIGFGNGRRQFGWLLGPQFYIGKDGKPMDVHTPIRHSFAAEVGVPAWWSGLGLKGRCYWLGDDGALIPALPAQSFVLKKNDISSSQKDDIVSDDGDDFLNADPDFNLKAHDRLLKPSEIWPPYEYDAKNHEVPGPTLIASKYADRKLVFRTTTFVRLPTDPAAITTALLYQNDRTQRQPSIEPVWHASDVGNAQSPHYTLQATALPPAAQSAATAPSDQTLVIRGRDLWRNPQVTIGNIPATSVDIMPDMGGLVAHFNYIPMPQHHGSANPLIDLTVTTTFGSDTLRGVVEIFPATTPAKSSTFLTIPKHWADINTSFTFVIDPTNLDPVTAASAELRFRVHGSVNGTWQVVAPQPTSIVGTNMTFALPNASDLTSKYNLAPGFSAGAPALLDVDVAVAGAGSETTVLAGSPQILVIYAQDTERQPKWTPSGSTIQMILPTIAADQEHLLDAYPELIAAIDAAKTSPTLFSLQLTPPLPPPAKSTIQGTVAGDPPVVTFTPSGLVNSTSYQANLVWTDQTSTSHSIPMQGISMNANGAITQTTAAAVTAAPAVPGG
jgi:hypothetical protein